MIKYSIDVRSDTRYPVDRKRIRERVTSVLSDFGVEGDVSVGVSFVGDRKMLFLNSKYRKIKKTTDVLSFPTEDLKKGGNFVYPEKEPFPLGDIVVSYPQARSQAGEANVLVDDEIDRLVEHGVKSLLGHHPE